MSKTFTVAELAEKINAAIHQVDPQTVIHAIKALPVAGAGELSFYEPAQRVLTVKDLRQSQAAVMITTDAHLKDCANGALIVEHPKQAYAILAALFEERIVPKPGVHPKAVIGENCQVADTASIAAGAVVGDGAVVGAYAVVGANAVIGEQAVVGDHTCIMPNVTIYPKVQIGQHVHIDSGTTVGADGFGFVPDKQGVWQRVPQIGSVIIKDYVSIGAGCTIDCGALADTLIGEGVKIDDQVHIAHNVVIGAHTVIAGYSAIAGSVTIGKHCILAGGVRFTDNLSITDKVIITAGGSVAKDITEPGVFGSGIPVAPMSKWRRILARLYQLDTLAKKVAKLEKTVNE